MRIILCTEFYHDRGGAYAAALDAEWLLRSRGHEVIPFAARHPANRRSPYETHFVRYHDLRTLLKERRIGGLWRLVGRFVWSVEAYAQLERLIEDVRPDVVHIHNYAYHLTSSVFEAPRAADAPLVHTMHDYKLLCPQLSMLRHGKICERCRRFRFIECFRHRCVARSFGASLCAALQNYRAVQLGSVWDLDAAFVSPSGFLRQKCLDWGWPGPDIQVVPNFVRPVEQTTDSRADGGRPFLFAGRLTPEKGLATLIEAIRSVPTAKLLVAGEGPERERLEPTAPPNVSFLGAVPRAQMPQLYGNALAVVVPSEWYENCSLTVLEAFAAGRPVVASRIGGLPEQVAHEKRGLLFPPGDAEALAGALRRLHSNAGRADELGRNARAAAATEYSPEVHYERLLEIYRSV